MRTTGRFRSRAERACGVAGVTPRSGRSLHNRGFGIHAAVDAARFVGLRLVPVGMSFAKPNHLCDQRHGWESIEYRVAARRQRAGSH